MKAESGKDLSSVLAFLQKDLASFIKMLEDTDYQVRNAVSELIFKMNEHGLLQLMEAAKYFIRILNDCNL